MCLIIEKKCNIHGVTDFTLKRKSKTRKHDSYECKKCRNEYVHKSKIKRKLKAIEYKGGKCSKCGYDKNLSALEFHHVNSNEKDFEISRYISKSWESLVIELDKCILVCSNCHKEIHNPKMDRLLLIASH